MEKHHQNKTMKEKNYVQRKILHQMVTYLHECEMKAINENPHLMSLHFNIPSQVLASAIK